MMSRLSECYAGLSEQECEIHQAMHPESWAQIQELQDEELVRRFDLLAQDAGGLQLTFIALDYREELNRRASERQGKRLERLTAALVWLTVAILALTAVLVWSELAP